ncbi:MAG: hypothetical protein GY819_08365 [Planctomycetaceae bacterium]|nr:hypothetical protein [Planctomycetaceae bacterium]MCP4462791.1 hypothetical protein [Planctomycetaceae bacterium]
MKHIQSLILMLTLAFTATASGQDELTNMIQRLPAESNSVFLINGKAVRDAPPAVMEKWKTTYSAANSASPMALPEGVQYAVSGTEFDIQHMAPLKQVVVLELKDDVSADAIAKARNGVVDQIGDTKIVWINEACVFVDSKNMVTVVSPMNRQSAARWLNRRDSASALSPYLNEVADRFGKSKPQITFAVDLSNFFGQSIVRRAVEQSGIFDKSDYDQITKIITSIRGVTIESELVYETCAISIDFAEEISALKPHAEQFVSSALKAAGANLGNLDDWQIDVYKNRISLTGKLTPSIMQRIFSLNTLGGVAGKSGLTDTGQPPASATAEAPKAKPERAHLTATERLAASKRQREIKANQKYFNQITEMLNDLSQGHSTNTLNDNALWISNYVRRLQVTPTMNLDPELVQHGKYVARSLENVVGTLHMTNDRIVDQQIDNTIRPDGDLNVTAIPTRRYNYGGHVRYRYAPMYSRNYHIGSAQENFAIEDREIGRANSDASQVMSQVYADHERVRQDLTEKYGVPF